MYTCMYSEAMSTHAEVETVSYFLDADAYTKHGAFEGDPQVWADTFKSLGGERCGIEPSWRHGLPVGEIFMTVVGTPESIAYVDATLVV